jgi:hypothetical protein
MFELRDATKATKARGPMVIRVSELVLALPRPAKRIIALLVDILICAATVALAYWLRLGEWVWPSGTQWLSYVVAIMIAIPFYIRFGLYRAIFRFVGWGAMNSVIRASIVYGVAYALLASCSQYCCFWRSAEAGRSPVSGWAEAITSFCGLRTGDAS